MRETKAILHAAVSAIVKVQSHEISALLHSSGCFFFILSAYFVVLPLRDDGAISLGLSNLPTLFVGSLFLTLIAVPLSTYIFSIPQLSKSRALLLIHRFFSVSLIVCFFLWHFSSAYQNTPSENQQSNDRNSGKNQMKLNDTSSTSHSLAWSANSWFYAYVRIGFFLWVALFNLIAISSTWARVIDVMDSESGSRLFGFIGAGATLGQLFGSLFATGMAWLGSSLLLFSALLMEMAAQCSKGIVNDSSIVYKELSTTRDDEHNFRTDENVQSSSVPATVSPKSPQSEVKPQFTAVIDGIRLVLSSTYLLYVSSFLWLSAVVSSFFYFQKVTVVAETVTSAEERRKLFAEINSWIAAFILTGQLTITGRILTVAGVTLAICSAPLTALFNLTTVALWPTWLAVALCETLRKVVTYVVTRPGRELLFTVVSQEEKYKAKICIDVIVQRLGDATAAGLFKLLSTTLNGKSSIVSLCALPVCLVWMVVALQVGQLQSHLARSHALSAS